MKQVIAIIRAECAGPSCAALAALGISPVAVFPVTGRGQQEGAPGIPDQDGLLGRNFGPHLRRERSAPSGPKPPGDRAIPQKKSMSLFLPKQMLIIMADENDVEPAMQALIAVNQSGQHGDGKVFVCPLTSAV